MFIILTFIAKNLLLGVQIMIADLLTISQMFIW